MVNLTEILQKELRNDGNLTSIGESLLFDNYTRHCLLQTDKGIFAVDKVTPRWDYVAVTMSPWQNRQLTKRTDNKHFLKKIEIGQKIYNQNGASLGEVVDVELTSKFALQRLLTSSGRYLKRSDVVAVGDAVIAKAKSAKRKVADELRNEAGATMPKQHVEKPSVKRSVTVADTETIAQTTATNETTHTQNIEQRNSARSEKKPSDEQFVTNAPNTVTEETPQTAVDTSSEANRAQTATSTATANVVYFSYGQTEFTNSEMGKPARRVTARDNTMRRKYGDFSFLVGKSVDKTMHNFQGEVMIKQHEVITREVLRQAKIAGKLLELYLHIE